MSEVSLVQQMARFFEQFQSQFRFDDNDWPMVLKDSDWPSPCESGPEVDENIGWKPVTMPKPIDFAGVENALTILINDDIKDYYQYAFSDGIQCQTERGELNLIFVWNEDDARRLLENIIGHLMMKQKLKQRATIFFAHTDEDDLFLSVINATGEVVLERPGMEPHEIISPNLAEFMASLTVIK